MYTKKRIEELINELDRIEEQRKKLLKSILLEVIKYDGEEREDTKVILKKVEKNIDLREYVTKVMTELGIPASLNGYQYIRAGVLIFLSDKNKEKMITKDIYPEIAVQFKTTPSRVERGIRHAIEVSCSRGNMEYLNEIFGYSISNFKGVPTNGEFLSKVSDKISLELNI